MKAALSHTDGVIEGFDVQPGIRNPELKVRKRQRSRRGATKQQIERIRDQPVTCLWSIVLVDCEKAVP